MDKKTYTVLFVVVSTLINIVCTLIMIAALVALAVVILNWGFKCKNGSVYMVVFMICFMAGMVLNMFIFSRISAYVIEKHNLAAKLDPKILGKTLPNGKRNQAAYDEEKNRKQTVMPDSVIDKDDEWGKE